jgi:hypothetical protein
MIRVLCLLLRIRNGGRLCTATQATRRVHGVPGAQRVYSLHLFCARGRTWRVGVSRGCEPMRRARGPAPPRPRDPRVGATATPSRVAQFVLWSRGEQTWRPRITISRMSTSRSSFSITWRMRPPSRENRPLSTRVALGCHRRRPHRGCLLCRLCITINSWLRRHPLTTC